MINMTGTAETDERIAQILRGEECIVTFPGLSQYSESEGESGSGSSACGLASFNCARIVLSKEQDGVQGIGLLKALIRRETFQEIFHICARWDKVSHLEAEEIQDTPIFRRYLRPTLSEYGRPKKEKFEKLLRLMKTYTPRSIAAILTRPPEVVCVLKLAILPTDIFVVFDSHPRPRHPLGGGLTFSGSLKATAAYLESLFHYDENLLEDEDLQWEAQLLANFNAQLYVASDAPRTPSAVELDETLIESSLVILSMKLELDEARQKINILEAENRRLENRYGQSNSKIRDLEAELRRLGKQPVTKLTKPSPAKKYHFSGESTVEEAMNRPIINSSTSNSIITNFNHPSVCSGNRAESSSSVGVRSKTIDADPYRLQTSASVDMKNGEDVAYRLQSQFNDEHRQLLSQLNELQREDVPIFSCGICMDDFPIDSVVRVETCGHQFCRDCTRGHVHAQLQALRFPVQCPICSAEKKKDNIGVVDGSLVQILGISQEDYLKFEELQIVVFGVPLHCRKCQQMVYVDKEDYRATDILTCPFPRCNYVWCKHCSQEIAIGGPKHSCDGSNELGHLMKQRGWKYCPGCRTPTDKSEGCNHMTCATPGCYTHFCYVCGELIVQSINRDEIQTSVSAHYRRCRLFVY